MRNVLPVPAAAALAVLAAVVVAISGCSGGSPQAASQPSAGTSPAAAASPAAGTPRLHWHQCAGLAGQLRCASLRVPVDYRHPGGRKITLALSEVPATAPSGRLGALLVNPGGPGGSGLSLAAGVADGLDPAVAARYDIIGFDPRGVGSSTPALHCDPSFFAGARPDYIPASKAAERVLTGRAKAYAASTEKVSCPSRMTAVISRTTRRTT